MMKKRMSWAIVLAAAMLVSGVSYHAYRSRIVTVLTDGPISEYQTEKEADAIRRIFREHFQILTEDPNFNVDAMLRTRSPHEYEPQYFGKMKIMVMHEGDEPVGFITYYLRRTYEGHILFLAVDKDYRRKGYGRKLFVHAMNHLKQMGAKVIKVDTRVENNKAQALYESLGFQLKNENSRFKFYRKEV